jgi:hypothetical protein
VSLGELDTNRSVRLIRDYMAFSHQDPDDNQRQGIETLLSAHDYIWHDETRGQFDRLKTCNLLYETALKFLNG